MILKTCFRCDWHGETEEASCPNCGVKPLFVADPPPSRKKGMPVGDHPEEPRDGAASTVRVAPSDPAPRPDPSPSPSPAETVEPAGRSTRSAVAFVLLALVLTLTLGTWLNAHEDRPAPSASTDPAEQETLASDSSAPTPGGEVPIEGSLIARHALTVGGIPFSFSAPRSGWERFGNTSINKSTVGPQGAEAIIFWSSFPDGDRADPCSNLLSPSARPSAADLANAVATAPGTELVTGPSNVTVGGRPAKHVALTVRKDVGCDPGFFYSWQDREVGAFWSTTRVGVTINVWIVDVADARLFFEAETTEQAGSDLEHEIQQIVRSIRF